MTRQRAKELLPIIQAYIEGKKIQVRLWVVMHPLHGVYAVYSKAPDFVPEGYSIVEAVEVLK